MVLHLVIATRMKQSMRSCLMTEMEYNINEVKKDNYV